MRKKKNIIIDLEATIMDSTFSCVDIKLWKHHPLMCVIRGQKRPK